MEKNKRYDYDSFFVISEDINSNITVTEVILKKTVQPNCEITEYITPRLNAGVTLGNQRSPGSVVKSVASVYMS